MFVLLGAPYLRAQMGRTRGLALLCAHRLQAGQSMMMAAPPGQHHPMKDHEDAPHYNTSKASRVGLEFQLGACISLPCDLYLLPPCAPANPRPSPEDERSFPSHQFTSATRVLLFLSSNFPLQAKENTRTKSSTE